VKSKKVYFFPRAALLVLLVLAGCVAGVKNEDSSVIKTRASERWDLLIAHHAEKAYDYLSPGYRATKTRDDYATEMNHRGIQWSKVNFVSQECDADLCHVHLGVDYTINLGGLVGKTKSVGMVVETWVRVKGQWYFLPDQFQPTKLGKDS
jgi:hypothetical protein